MRLVTSYTWHDFKDPSCDYYPSAEAKRVLKAARPHLIGKTLNKIFVSGLMGSGSHSQSGETIYEYEKRMNEDEVKKGKPAWQIRQHLDWGHSIVFLIDNNYFEIEMWVENHYIISMNNFAMDNYLPSTTNLKDAKNSVVYITGANTKKSKRRFIWKKPIKDQQQKETEKIPEYKEYVDISCCYDKDVIGQTIKRIVLDTEIDRDENEQEIEYVVGIKIILGNERTLYISSPIDWPVLDIIK